MIREYVTPDFDVTVYEVEDVITASVPPAFGPESGNPDGGEWWG